MIPSSDLRNVSDKVVPVAGDRLGLIARRRRRLLFLGAGSESIRGRLIALVERDGSDDECLDHTASALLGSSASCALVIDGEQHRRLLIHGTPTVAVVSPTAGRVPLSAFNDTPGRHVIDRNTVVTIGCAEIQHLATTERLDAGIVAADGVVITAAVAAPLPPEAGHPTPTGAPLEPPSRAQVDHHPSMLGGRFIQPPQVDGILCARQHFNNPNARFCRTCGLAMHHGSIVAVRRRRPTLGQLVFDTGETFQIGSDVVVGRQPDDHSLVASGDARSMLPAGDVSGLSRTHAALRIRGWDVLLEDLGSLNGTFIWERESGQWRRLPPMSQQPINVGDTLAFARRTATFESALAPR